MGFGSLALGFMFQTLATYDFRNNGNETLKVARLDFFREDNSQVYALFNLALIEAAKRGIRSLKRFLKNDFWYQQKQRQEKNRNSVIMLPR